MDWLAPLLGFLAGFIPTLPSWFMLSRQLSKMDAEREKTNAETAERWQNVYESALEMQVVEINRLTQDRDLGRERIRNQQAQIGLLHEQKTAAIGSNLALTAELAGYKGKE